MLKKRATWLFLVIALVAVIAAGYSLAQNDSSTDNVHPISGINGTGSLDVGTDVEPEGKAVPPIAIGAGPGAKPAPTAPTEAQRSASSDAGSASGATGATSQQNILDRKIIYNASLQLTVEDVSRSFQEVQNIAQGAGGVVASSRFYLDGAKRLATVTIRVPVTAYNDVLGQLRRLALEVEHETSSANDVTEEYTDLSARLRNLEATEAQYLAFLGQAKNVAEVLQVQDRINATRQEIERVKGRMQLLERLTDLATIQVNMQPEAAAKPDATSWSVAQVFEDAWESSLRALRGVAEVVITLAVYSMWIIVPLVGLLLIVRYAGLLPRRSESRSN